MWDLFSSEVGQFERTWNTNIRRMFNLPLTTHRYLIEPISGTRHLKKILIQRFISFLHQISNSTKIATKQLLSFILTDTRSNTGSNVRQILRLTNRYNWKDVKKSDIDAIDYHDISEHEKWRVSLISDLLELQMNNVTIDGFSFEDLELILNYACTS